MTTGLKRFLNRERVFLLELSLGLQFSNFVTPPLDLLIIDEVHVFERLFFSRELE